MPWPARLVVGGGGAAMVEWFPRQGRRGQLGGPKKVIVAGSMPR